MSPGPWSRFSRSSSPLMAFDLLPLMGYWFEWFFNSRLKARGPSPRGHTHINPPRQKTLLPLKNGGKEGCTDGCSDAD